MYRPYAPPHWPPRDKQGSTISPGEMPARVQLEYWARHKYLWDRRLGRDITDSERGSSLVRKVWE